MKVELSSTGQGATAVVTMTVAPSRGEEVDHHFREDVRPWAQRQPGFVRAQWLRAAGGDCGLGVVTFETEDQALRVAEGPRTQPRMEGRAWNTDAVAVYRVVADA